MAALVTLEQAKGHLREQDADADVDVQFRIEQASGIILDYLKGRANVVATIDSSTVAAASVLTTDEAHGFVTGNTAVIADHDDSVPDLNGSHVVTVIDSTSFSVPVVVTTAGSGGTATVAWTDVTAPVHVQAAVLLMLTHLYENRGDDMKADEAVWSAIGRVLMRSRDPAFA